MTDEQLRKIANEYAESLCSPEDFSDKEEYDIEIDIQIWSALPVLRWLAKDYEIIKTKQNETSL